MPRGRPRKSAGGALIRSAELIGWAIGGLEREIVATRNRLGALNAQAAKLRKSAGRRASQALEDAASAVKPGRGRRRKMSAEGRKKIAEAAKRRWAKWRAEHKNR
jgi:hypothetical protein